MDSVSRFIPDAANALRAADAAAITADTAISAGALVSPIGAIWNDAVKDGKVVLFFKASAIDFTTTDETYALEIITSTAANLGSPQVHSSHPLAAVEDSGDWKEILVDQRTLRADDTDAKYWGVNVNVSGTTPSITFEMYLLPPVGK